MNKTIPAFLRATLVSLCLLLVGCSGDGRSLIEAVETNDLQLGSIAIMQPPQLLSDLVVNTGVQLKFSIDAKNRSGQPVALSSNNRRWSVSRPELASIDENGNFVSIAEGNLSVKLQIGGFEAEFPMQILNETLSSINQIIGDETLERCIPKNYSATGLFSQGSTRGLTNVTWDIVNKEVGTVGVAVNGVVPVTGVNEDILVLTATVGDVSEKISITVSNSLQTITITPETLAVEVGNSLSLGATGTYLNDSIERDVAITGSVTWRAPENNGIATVSNLAASKGVVSPIAQGSTQITASCGNISAQKALVVLAAGSTSQTSIAFEGNSPRVLSLSEGQEQLRVSTGSVYNSDNDKTTDADTVWAVVTGSDIVSFSSTAGKGTIVPLATGVATIRATYKELSKLLEVQVAP